MISDYATPFGGAELQILDLRAGLRKRGIDARLFSSNALGGAQNLADYQCWGTTSSFRTLVQTANPFAVWALHRVLREFVPDVVHVRLFLTQLSPLILPLLEDIPSLYHIAWYRPICPLGTKLLPNEAQCHYRAGAVCFQQHCLRLRDWLPLMLQMRLWRQWCDVFKVTVVESAHLKSRLEEEGISPIQIIPPGVTIRPIRPPLSSPPTVAFAGRLVHEKGVDVLLESFARVVRNIPDTQLLIAGDGIEHRRLEKRVASLGLSKSVLFLGQLTRVEMERRFDQAWVQVIPSRWAEPFGLTVIESMMRGTPVIASDLGGPAELIQNEKNGLLVQPDDPDVLGDAITRVLQNRDWAEELGKAARQVALARWNADAGIDRYVQLYQSLLERRTDSIGN